ncbi:unnamed protein product [Arabidopsis halleri]
MSLSAQNPDTSGDRQSGQDDCTQEVMACQHVSNIAKTSLGPVGLDQMGADDIGDVTIETDSATILRMLEVEQPAASVFDRIRNQATAWHAAASKNFKTSLDPVELDRMGADDIGDVTIETDSATILRMLEVEQPAASVFDRIRDQATAWHAAASKNFKTSLGPVGLDRMRADDIGDVSIETDGATILRLLEVEQPAASVFDRTRDLATAWHAAASKNFKTSLGPVGLDRVCPIRMLC